MSRDLSDLLRLDGRVAVVTGAARGIGAAIGARLCELGATVVGLDRDWPNAPAGKVQRLSCDVTKPGALESLAQSVFEQHGRLDLWVSNAGAAPRRALADMSREEWESVLALNLDAAFEGGRAAAVRMARAQRGGVIVNLLSSCIGHVGGNPAHYRAAKAGLCALNQSLATEFGPAGVRSVGIAPTLANTPQVDGLRAQGYGEALDRFVRRLPLGRLCEADEVAAVVAFAASDMASYITGSVIYVDGGETAL